METIQEKAFDSKNQSKALKKPKAVEPHRVINSGQIEIALWLSQTATGITYPQFTLSRLFTSQSTGRKAASRYYDDTNEAELLEAIRLGAAATRELRDELASGRKAA
jgi:hypothetical protein